MTETRSDTRSRWALLRTTLATQRRNLTIATLIGLLWMCGKVAVPWLVGIGIDRGIEADDRVWLWSGLVAAAGVASGIFTAFRRYYAFREARWTETKLREQLFGHILRLHIGYHDRSQTGQLMSRSSSDLQQIQAFVVMIPITLSNLAMVISVTVILALTNPLLTVVALAPLPLVNFAGRRFSSSIHPAVQAVQQEQAELATVVEETVSGVRVIKGFGAESVQSAKLEVEADDIRRVSIDAAKIRAKYLPAIELLPQIGLIGVLGVGGLQVIDGTLTLGELVSFNIYVALLVAPLRMLGMTIAWGQRAAAALKRINEVLDTVPLITDPEQPTALPTAQTGSAQTGSPQRCAPMGAVRFDRVEFGYDDDLPVLKNFNLELAAGQSIALVGGTGSGKSTVARLLIRFYDAEAGSITIDGVPIGDLALHELRRAVGVVFEDTLLFHDSVAANIAFADPAASHDAIERAARLAGAHDFIVGLPDAYETELGERGYSLSGGQRQRIAIARAILADPRILVLDDATSAVDPSKEHEIRSAMSTVMDGRTTIVIAHRPGTIALADTVALVDEGRVIATGTHDHLLATDARYREVLAAMSDADRAAAGPTGSGRS
ncbi:ABC transporter ATP-binding protein [uncultured Ilumatobacter sp.]|uniref:ABC transporter ATP-binding protein n=1 Tax=uncultured Ilumatobacter sp. TaxID=879968 RepID=UPI00374E2E43